MSPMLSKLSRFCSTTLSSRQVQTFTNRSLTRRPQGKSRSLENHRWQERRVDPNLRSIEIEAAQNSKTNGWSVLVRPFFFTVGFGAFSFAAASVWQYENMRNFARLSWKREGFWNKEIERFRNSSFHESIFGKLEIQKANSIRQELNRLWNSLSEGQRAFAPILAANVAVFLAWQIPRPHVQRIMQQYFACNPFSKTRCLPMLLSTFSHKSFIHLAVNMYVLHNFSASVVPLLGKEQFMGVYMASGVISSFASSFYKVMTSRSGLSVGASGAVLTMIGIVGALMPEARFQIIFLPMYTFTASTGIKALMAFDMIGCIARWRFFDHAAHLGGLLFGLWWVHYGNAMIWSQREHVMRLWHNYVRGRKGPPPPKSPSPRSPPSLR